MPVSTDQTEASGLLAFWHGVVDQLEMARATEALSDMAASEARDAAIKAQAAKASKAHNDSLRIVANRSYATLDWHLSYDKPGHVEDAWKKLSVQVDKEGDG